MAEPRAFLALRSGLRFLIVLIAPLLLAWAAAAQQMPPIRVVGSIAQPFAFIDSRGRPTGFAVDIIRAVGNRLGRDVKITLVPNRARAMEMIVSGEADVISGTIPTREGSVALAFSRPISSVSIRRYALRHRAAEFESNRLPGVRIAVGRGSIAADALAKVEGAVIVPYETVESMMLAINTGEVDLVAAPEAIWERVIRMLGIDDKYVAVGKPLLEGDITFGVDRRQPDLLVAIDGALLDFLSGTELEELREKWYGSDPFWTVETLGMAASTTIAVILGAWLLAYRLGLRKSRVARLREAVRCEHQALEHTRQLEHKNLLLKESHAEMERILFAVTHDLKSPIVTVRGFVGVLEEAADEGDLAAMQSAAKRIIAGTDKLGLVTDALLAFGSFGRSEINLSTVEMTPVLFDVKTMLTADIAEAGARIESRGPLHRLNADQSQVLRLLLNLVGNALRYGCPRPGMTIEVSTEPGDGGTVLTVRDHGPGVPENLRKDVFRLFRRYGAARPDSTGLGLAIVEKIMSKHGGDCWIEDGEGGGAAFRAFFPDRADEAFAQRRMSA